MNEIGSDVKFEFSQLAIVNINRLLKILKIRLASSGKVAAKDRHDNTVYTDCDIYSTDQLVGFLVLSLSEFNQTPPFTYFTFEDTKCIEFFTEALVSGATLFAFASQALIERGREFQIVDNGIIFDPPNVSEMLNTQYSKLLEKHSEKIKTIKAYITYWNSEN